jgi:hypothetical protein
MSFLIPQIELDIGDEQATIISVDMPVVELGAALDMPMVEIGVPGPTGPPGPNPVQVTGFFRSGVMTPGPGDYRIYNLSGVTRELLTVGIALRAPSTSAFICDVNLNDITIFTTQSKRPTITAGQNYGVSGSPDVTNWPHGGYLTVDRDVIGGTPGIDLTGEIGWRVLKP